MSTSNSDSRTPGKFLKAKERSKFRLILFSLPVIALFVVITIIAWLIPLRPTMSQTENRNLEKFPKFGMAVLLDGSYFDDIGVWFSDTFTFREAWIDTANELQSLYGTKSVAIYGEIGEMDDIPEISVSAKDPTEAVDATVGESEKVEATVPSQESSNVTEPTQENYDPREEGEVETAPKDATQSSWGGQKIEEADYVGTGAVIQIGNATYNFTGFSQYYADLYSASMSKAAELLDGKSRLFAVLGLENTTFMLTREDRISMGCKPEEDAIEYMYSNMDSRVNKVSVFENLVAHNNEYLAFRTDHHWTATAAYYAYETWCQSAGFEPVPLSEYEVIEYPGFKGSYYARASKSDLLEEDTVVCYVPPGNVKLYLSDNSHDGLGWEQPLITDRTYAPESAKYLAFLAGDHAKSTFINDDITDGSSCLVIKTSVGNPFVYYLSQHYQYVYVLDIRYYSGGRYLTSFVDHYGIDDVIFMHGTGLAMSVGGNEAISAFVK